MQAKQIKATQSRTKQSEAERSRAKQSDAKQSGAKQRKHNKPEELIAKQNKTKPKQQIQK